MATKEIISRFRPVKLFLILLAGGLLCLFAFNYFSNNEKAEPASADVSIETIKFPAGWGYKIEVNKKLFIYQDRIPCLPGKKLFPTRHSAMSVAELVKEKILQGESPSVSKAEIEKVLSKDI